MAEEIAEDTKSYVGRKQVFSIGDLREVLQQRDFMS